MRVRRRYHVPRSGRTGQPVRSTDLYDRCFGQAGVDFLMSRSRADTDNPPSRLWVFSERITFYPAGVKPKGGGTTGADALGSTELKWFEPGYKARFSWSTQNSVCASPQREDSRRNSKPPSGAKAPRIIAGAVENRTTTHVSEGRSIMSLSTGDEAMVPPPRRVPSTCRRDRGADHPSYRDRRIEDRQPLEATGHRPAHSCFESR
jgi:hypothetical protein